MNKCEMKRMMQWKNGFSTKSDTTRVHLDVHTYPQISASIKSLLANRWDTGVDRSDGIVSLSNIS